MSLTSWKMGKNFRGRRFRSNKRRKFNCCEISGRTRMANGCRSIWPSWKKQISALQFTQLRKKPLLMALLRHVSQIFMSMKLIMMTKRPCYQTLQCQNNRSWRRQHLKNSYWLRMDSYQFRFCRRLRKWYVRLVRMWSWWMLRQLIRSHALRFISFSKLVFIFLEFNS